ncbi:unnamed protein product [Nippostrongylus brasiliensis]|uniref:BRCC36_C domain-containing protein n=1 Tax=Nippostrongylus brasiliensis TaxID=27835 RepID=A0A0N4XPZ8_NIPBR|nr:unnamed protein product [Nippostrongylus brasiliensis]
MFSYYATLLGVKMREHVIEQLEEEIQAKQRLIYEQGHLIHILENENRLDEVIFSCIIIFRVKAWFTYFLFVYLLTQLFINLIFFRLCALLDGFRILCRPNSSSLPRPLRFCPVDVRCTFAV